MSDQNLPRLARQALRVELPADLAGRALAASSGRPAGHRAMLTGVVGVCLIATLGITMTRWRQEPALSAVEAAV